MALLPAKVIDYDTIVLEQTRTLYIQQTPLEIIKAACYNEWYTYEGRREAVMRHTNFRNKVPIPICSHKEIYFFPTHSPNLFENHWLSYKHIVKTTSISRNAKTSTITFLNGAKRTIPMSSYSLNNQMKRTFECMYRMTVVK